MVRSWQPLPREEAAKKLTDYEAQQLIIIKQAILKSSLEGGAIVDRNPESEKFLEDWIKWIYRQEEKDYKLAKEQNLPF